MRKTIFLGLFICLAMVTFGQAHLSIPNPSTWNRSALSAYVGQEVIFDAPMYVCSNRNGYTVSPRRTFAPTNQAYPLSEEYDMIVSLNASGLMSITGFSGYHRLGERIANLRAKVNSVNSITYLGGTWVGNTRSEMAQGVDMSQIDALGQHNLLVCGFNLEYYLVEDFSSPGPRDNAEHQQQRAKVSEALATIQADIFGLVEIQQGTKALSEICADLKTNTGRTYSYVSLTSSSGGTFTQSAYVYDVSKVKPIGNVRLNNKGVQNRKAQLAFEEIATGERFIYSINHFKAKSGTGTGKDADQGDGQGGFNATRVQEALSVLEAYSTYRNIVEEQDILVMGDLNAYAKEDPIKAFLDGGFIDMHRYFHADSSYSYVYSNQAGYLDHAIVNPSMLTQVTGMCGYHINSDESDNYTYDKSSDYSMFRCSDHDPVVVGLRLGSDLSQSMEVNVNSIDILCKGADIVIANAQIDKSVPAFYRIYNGNGILITSGQVPTGDNYFTIPRPTYPGVYVVQVFSGSVSTQRKAIIY